MDTANRCRSPAEAGVHTGRIRRFLRTGLVLAVTAAGLLSPRGLHAQLRAPLGASTGSWAPVELGIRFGRDSALHYNVVGAQLRLPVVPSGKIEIMPNMDMTFARGDKEYQYNFEAVYVMDGRYGLYGGGGVGIRRARFGPDPAAPLETVHGYSAVLGLKISGLGLVVPQVEWRWNWIKKENINPQQVTLGVNLALWR